MSRVGVWTDKKLSFKDARAYLHTANIKNVKEYLAWRRNSNMTQFYSQPDRAFIDKGWTNWADYLNTDTVSNQEIHRKFLPYEEAKAIVHAQKFRTYKDYSNWQSRPSNVPSYPQQVYGTKYQMEDYLGRAQPTPRDKFKTFEEARQWVHAYQKHKKPRMTSVNHWEVFSKDPRKRPKDIPSKPASFYRGEWKTWSDFLGNPTPPAAAAVAAAAAPAPAAEAPTAAAINPAATEVEILTRRQLLDDMLENTTLPENEWNTVVTDTIKILNQLDITAAHILGTKIGVRLNKIRKDRRANDQTRNEATLLRIKLQEIHARSTTEALMAAFVDLAM